MTASPGSSLSTDFSGRSFIPEPVEFGQPGKLVHLQLSLIEKDRVAQDADLVQRVAFLPLGMQERDDARQVRERVADKLLSLDRTLEPLLPPLLALLDVPVDDGAWDALDPPQRRQRMLEAVKWLLLRESQVRPLLLVVADLHWIDSESQALLHALIDSLPAARVLLVVDYRPEYQHAWASKSYYTQLRVDPLPSESAEELLTALLGQDEASSPSSAS